MAALLPTIYFARRLLWIQPITYLERRGISIYGIVTWHGAGLARFKRDTQSGYYHH